MAVCKWCDQEMTNKVSCTHKKYSFDGRELDRLPYLGPGQQCHDCGTPREGLHHPGCDMERCPMCGGQAISCGCEEEEGFYLPEDPVDPDLYRMEQAVTDYIFKFYDTEDGFCTLCANSGVVDTLGLKNNGGVVVGRRQACLCPNGQAMRRRGTVS